MTKAFEIFVVACPKRHAIVLDSLKEAGLPHHVRWTTDYKLEPGWKPLPAYASLVRNQVGAYRCFRGHQDTLAVFRDLTPKTQYALVFEDDAQPITPTWLETAATAVHLLDEFEVVGLHGRQFSLDAFETRQFDSKTKLLIPKKQGDTWVVGSLAYLIRKDVIDRLISATYEGYPVDLFLFNRFKFAFIDPSPFAHNQSCGSLIDCRTPVD